MKPPCNVIYPYLCPNNQRMRQGDCLSIENGSHHLATTLFYFLLVVGHALPGSQDIINNDNVIPLYISCDTVIPL